MPHSVLCVDDDRNLCQILARALEGEGYRVRQAHDGDAAVAAFEQDRPDLVLLDVLLPRRDGFGVLEAIGGRSAALLLTGCSRTPEYEERARKLGVAGFLTKPVPLASLLEEVRAALAVAPVPEAPPAPSAIPRERRVWGFLEEMPLPALLHQLHGLRASGALLLRHGRKRKALQLREGRPVAVRSNLVSECLGHMLMRMGRIDRAALEESTRRMRQGEGLQGEILVAMDVLSEAELDNALRVQAEEKLLELFEWSEGRFELCRGSRIKDANSLDLGRSPASLIIEGVCTRFPIERIDAELRRHGDAQVVAGESPFYLFQEVTLGAAARELLERIPHGVNVAETLRADAGQRRILYGLLATEMVELASAGVDAPPDPALAAREDAVAAQARDRDEGSAEEAERRALWDEGIRTELASMVQRMRGRTYYEILDVGRDPTDEQVRAAYVDLAKRTHPDRFSNASDGVRRLAEEIFGIVSQAHEALATRPAREAYRVELAQGARLEKELEEGRRALAAEQAFRKGEACLRAREHQAAFQAFEKAVELYGEEGDYVAALGWARFLTHPDDPQARQQAVKELREGIKLAPESEKPYLLLGQLLKAIGRPENAERMFRKALELKADCVEALREVRLMNMRREKQRGLVRRWLRR